MENGSCPNSRGPFQRLRPRLKKEAADLCRVTGSCWQKGERLARLENFVAMLKKRAGGIAPHPRFARFRSCPGSLRASFEAGGASPRRSDSEAAHGTHEAGDVRCSGRGRKRPRRGGERLPDAASVSIAEGDGLGHDK